MSNRAVSLALVSLAFSVSYAAGAADSDPTGDAQLEAMRSAFRASYPQAELGNWGPADSQRMLLENYVLWPDLRAAWLRATMTNADHAEIEQFLDHYGVLKPARELRYRYALHLAGEKHLADYQSIYQQYYQGLGIAKLDCLALQAEISAGRDDRIVGRALALWRVGHSQADECDPVFENLKDRGLLTREHYEERFQLAIEARQFTLARYLSGPLGTAYRDEATSWLEAQQHPLEFIRSATDGDGELQRRQLVYAVERLAISDPLTAGQAWRKLGRRHAFSREQQNVLGRHIALWSARLHQPEAVRLLAALPADASDEESRHWLVRANLLQHQWAEVVRSVDAMPAAESVASEWQYWKAFASAQLGQQHSADAILREVAQERGYYGFLAADALGETYALETETIAGDPALAGSLAANPELIRARELFLVGLDGRGRSEWDSAVRLLTEKEQQQAALLAHAWGWHSRAIAAVASAGHYDDLEIRYPLPWRRDFEEYARSAGIAESWAYGIARSESLFMRDVRSAAGAIGIMQLMPETGRRTAVEIQLPYAGLETLTDTRSNIRLGTWYLSKMYTRFDSNRVLATAAYNAGPLRVDDWLPESGSLDARIWIENIPLNETRSYVRRVLADEAIFHWRLTGELRRISAELPQVVAPTGRAQSTR